MTNLAEPIDLSLFLDQEMLGTLHALDNGQGVFLDELIDIYVDSSPEVLVRLNLALEAGKIEQSRLLAHKLKGICGNLGLIRIISLLVRIEVSLEVNTAAEFKLLPIELNREHARSIELLNRHWHSRKKLAV